MAFFASKALQEHVFDSVYGDIGRAQALCRSQVRRHYETRILKIGLRALETSFRDCLDVGCGRGIFTALLGFRFRKVVAIDRSRRAVRTAGHVAGDRNIRFCVSDAGALPFENGAFDCVTAKDVLHHLDEPARAVSEMKRVLRPGGILISVEPNNRNWPGVAAGILLKHERKAVLCSPGFLIRQMVGRGFSILHYGMDGFFIPYGPLACTPARMLGFLKRFEDYMGRLFPFGGGHFIACYQKHRK
ncbi:class I SAM-dependent methyltransferase [bacterium]|nr:class I SAM-dependent methyltransferase [bacterium]